MKKIIFTNISTAVGLTVVVLVSAFFGGLFLREARSFVDPGSGPGGSGSFASDLGVIGKPSQGISGTSTLFQGQAAIKTAVDGIGGGGVFTKCQVKHSSSPVYPSCPSGYISIQSYASGHVFTKTISSDPHSRYAGFFYTDIDDSFWIYQHDLSAEVFSSVFACTICAK